MKIPPVRPFFPTSDVEKIKDYVGEILESGYLSLSEHTKYIKLFEKEFERYHEEGYGDYELGYRTLQKMHTLYARDALAVSSGTAALEIALRICGIGEGKRVLVQTNTFSASVASIIHAGAEPVLADINRENLCLDLKPDRKGAKIIDETIDAVMIVHVGGLMSSSIYSVVQEGPQTLLIEDCAQALGSTYDGLLAGTFGDVSCFSFYPTKIITTGEGGMLLTKERYKLAKKLRDQGRKKEGSAIITELGNNWRMDEIRAMIGWVQLSRLNEILEKRRKIARFYDRELKDTEGIRPLKIPEKCESNYYKYVVFCDDERRDWIKQELLKKGIHCPGEIYDPPIHLQPVYRRLLGTKEGDFPGAEWVAKHHFCLPIYPDLKQEEAEYVVESLKEIQK